MASSRQVDQEASNIVYILQLETLKIASVKKNPQDHK